MANESQCSEDLNPYLSDSASIPVLNILLVMLGLQPGNGVGLVGIPVEPIGKNEEGGCPETDKDSEALGIGPGLRRLALQKPPTHDRKRDGKDPELKADRAQGATSFPIHGAEATVRPRALKEIKKIRDGIEKRRAIAPETSGAALTTAKPLHP